MQLQINNGKKRSTKHKSWKLELNLIVLSSNYLSFSKVKRVRRPKGLMPMENMLEYGPLPLPGGYQVNLKTYSNMLLLYLCLQFSSGGLRSQKFMQLMAGRGEWSVTWKGHMIEYGSHIIGSLSKCSSIGMKALHHHHHHHQENWAQSSRMELSAKSVKTRRVLLPKEEPISGRPPAWGEPPSQSSGPRRPQGPGLCRQG